jgi:alpha-ketoglutarate-dependent 2,4-dichlorophenoxyacetate dioxygenase
MGLDIRPLHDLFGAEVRDRIAECEADAVTEAIGQYGLLLFRDVDFDDAALVGFAGHFGFLQTVANFQADQPQVVRVTNLAPDGSIKAADDPGRRLFDANLLWHIDNSFSAPGVTFSFMYAREVPDEGGDTEFCDNRVTWEALDEDRHVALLPLTAFHSLVHSRKLMGIDITHLDPPPPVERQLVRWHKPSGRESLVLASHIERVSGHDYESGQALIEELMVIASAPGCVYRHRWRVGDLLIWDNRCMMHRATPYADFDQPRDMRTARVVDEIDEGLAAAPMPEGTPAL